MTAERGTLLAGIGLGALLAITLEAAPPPGVPLRRRLLMTMAGGALVLCGLFRAALGGGLLAGAGLVALARARAPDRGRLIPLPRLRRDVAIELRQHARA